MFNCFQNHYNDFERVKGNQKLLIEEKSRKKMYYEV